MGRTVAKLLLFVVIGAVAMALAIEGSARVATPALPPLEVLTGQVASQPKGTATIDVDSAASTKVRRIVWLSPTAPDAATLAKTMSAELGETVVVTQSGHRALSKLPRAMVRVPG